MSNSNYVALNEENSTIIFNIKAQSFNRRRIWFHFKTRYNGHGKIYYKNFLLFEGYFYDGVIVEGILYLCCSSIFASVYRKLYDGKFKNGQFVRGKYYDTNGVLKYIGSFKNGAFDGRADYYTPDGKMKSRWIDGRLLYCY
jgi:hypothetical protein